MPRKAKSRSKSRSKSRPRSKSAKSKRRSRSQSRESSKRDSSKPKTKLTFLHFREKRDIVDGVSTLTEEEAVRDGPLGISFKFYRKKDDKTMKVTGRQSKDGVFMVKITKDKEVTTDKSDLTLAQTLTLIKGIKELDFVVKYLSKTKQKGGVYHYGGKRHSRKMKRKSTKKRKSSKKKSKKARKKSTRKKSTRKKSTRKKSAW